MTTRSSRHFAASLVVAALAISRGAFAEPNAADVETARGLYVEGLQLRDAAKLDISLARFKAAHALAATPITSLELGRAHALIFELVEARDVLLSVERMPVQASESPKAASARLEAHALAEQVRERIPSLRIVFTREPLTTPRVTIDGTPIPTEAVSTPRKVNPGTHTIAAETADGAHASATALLVEREVHVVQLTLGGSTPLTKVPKPAPPATESPGPTPWFYVGLGTAGIGVLTGTITGVIALSKAGSLEAQCTGAACPRSAEGDLSTSRTMGTISTIAFGVAGAGAVLAVVGWLTRPASGTPVRLTPNALRWSW